VRRTSQPWMVEKEEEERVTREREEETKLDSLRGTKIVNNTPH